MPEDDFTKGLQDQRKYEQRQYEQRQTRLNVLREKASALVQGSSPRPAPTQRPDFTSTADPTIVPSVSDPARDYTPLGISEQRPGEDLSKPLVPETGPPATPVYGRGGPEQDGKVRAALDATLDDNADQEATINRLATLTGKPAAALRALGSEEVSRMARELGVLTQTKDTPILRKKYTDQDFARLAADDVKALTGIEKTLRTLTPEETFRAGMRGFYKNTSEAVADSGPKVILGAPQAAAAGVVDAAIQAPSGILQGAAELLDEFLRSPSPALAAIAGNPEEANRIAREGNPAQDPSALLPRVAAWAEGGRKFGKELGDKLQPQTGNLTADSVLSGVRSAGSSLAWMAAAIGTGNPELALLGMSATTGGISYGQARDEGLAPFDAAMFGGQQGMIESLTERLPFHLLVKDIAEKTPFGQVVLRQLAAEVPTEQAATLLQDATEWAYLNPEKTVGEFLAERPEAAFQTLIATAVGTVLQTSVIKTADMVGDQVQKGKEREAREKTMAEGGIDALKELVTAASESKLRERNPAEFTKTIDEMAQDTPLTSVYIQPEAFAQIAQSEGKTPEALATEMGVEAQIETSLASGAPLQIPVGTFTEKVAGRDNSDVFLQNVTTSPFAATETEQQAMPEEQRQRLLHQAEKLTQVAQEKEGFAAGVETVRATVEQQLKAAGRFVGEPNRLYSQLTANGYGTLAARLGITPEEAFEQYPLKIVGEMLAGEAVREQTANNGTGNEQAPAGQTAEGMAQEAGFAYLDANPDARTGDIAEQLNLSAPQASRLRKAWKETRGVPNNKSAEGRTTTKLDQRNKGEYAPSTATLGLLRTADLSTFLHEIGHHFLEVHVTAASKLLERTRNSETLTPDEQGLLDDTQELLTQLKVAPGEPGPGQSYAQADTLWALTFYENYLPNATDEQVKALMQKQLDNRKLPVIRLFKTDKGRVIAFPAEYTHAEARMLLGDQNLPDADLRMDHAQIRYGQTIEDAHWYDRSGALTDQQSYAQLDSSSFRAARGATPQDRGEWYDTQVEEVALLGGARQLQIKSTPDQKSADIKINISPGSKEKGEFKGVSVDMMFKGSLMRPTGKVTPEQARQGRIVFTKTIVALQAYVERYKPDYLVFTGSGDSQAKFYEFMLKNFDLGYEARIETFYDSLQGANVSETTAIQVFTLINPEKAPGFALELSNATIDNVDFAGSPATHKRRRVTAIVRPGNPANVGDGRGADTAGAGSSSANAGVYAQSFPREERFIEDGTLERARDQLSEDQFNAFVMARNGASNEEIAQELGGEDATVSPEMVKVWLSRIRAKGFIVEKAPTPSGLSPDTLRVIAMSAQGARPKDIAEAVYPDRSSDKAALQVRVLRNRHKNLIEQYKLHREGKYAQGPIFYSALQRAVEKSTQKSAPAAQWKATLRNTAGVKQEEIEWTGLFDWLDSLDTDSVPKADVLNYLTSNGVKVEEVRVGNTDDLQQDLDDTNSDLENLYAEHGSDESEWDAGVRARISMLENNADNISRQIEGLEEGGTKFPSFTLPGGTDYTELLLTLPDVKGPSTHWDEPNVVAHVRFKTRQGADGSRVLAIEEVQSDWHQKGREQGYAGDAAPDRAKLSDDVIRAETRFADAGIELVKLVARSDEAFATALTLVPPHISDRLAEAREDLKTDDAKAASWAPLFTSTMRPELMGGISDAEFEPIGQALSQINELRRESLAAQEAELRVAQGVPNAPFKNNGWAALVLKRMVRWAAEHGYDSVAWIPGNIQNGQELEDTGDNRGAFYDKILVNEANKLGKKYGAVVGSTEIMLRTDAARLKLAAQGYRAEHQFFHALPITPELKAAALEGMPLFQPENPLSPEERKFFNEAMRNPEKVLPPGATPLDVWNSLSFAEKTPFHEEFARLTEAYFMEGKAPTPKLRGMFDKFRQWLLNVYETIKDLAVELTPEVSSILDRMYASAQDIAEAQDIHALAPLFTVKPEAMTDTEWRDYQSTNANATAEAETTLTQRSLRDVKWLGNARSKAIRRLQAEAREQRKAMGAEVAAEVMAEKVNVARNYLARGIDSKGQKVEPFSAVFGPDGKLVSGSPKLSIAALTEMYPDGTVDFKSLGYGKYGMLAKDGLHPDVLAPILGYESGDALVKDLLTAEPAKEKISGITDQRMLERYGDLVDDASIARAADEAVHSGLRARVLAGEYAALTAALGERKLLNEAAREAAIRIVARLNASKLNPAKFVAQERRAGRAAEEAVRKNDLAGAAAAKRDQLLNFHIAREVYAKQKERDAALNKFRQILTAKRDTVAKSRNFDLVQASRAVLSAYGLARMKNQPVTYLDAVKRYDPQLYASLEPTLLAAFTNNRKLTDLTVEQFLGMRDVVVQLWDLSRESMLVQINGQKLDLDDVATQIATLLESRGADGAKGITKAPTAWQRTLRIGEAWLAALRRVEAWARTVDGDTPGPMTKFLWRPVNQAATEYRLDLGKYITRFRELFAPMEAKLDGKQIAAPELGYTFRNRAELLHALLHTGNQSNKRKLLLGRRWGAERQDGSLDTGRWDQFVTRMAREGVLTVEDYQFAQGVWDLLEQIKPLAQQAHRHVFGRYFAEVTADPVQTPFGEFRGGYIPAVYDDFYVADASMRAAQNALESHDSTMFPAPASGFTQARVEYNKVLHLDLRLLGSHIDKVLKFAHMAAPVRDVLRIISTEKVKRLLDDFHPTAREDLLGPWLVRSARQTNEMPLGGKAGRGVSAFANGLRRRSSMGLMFANIANVVQQPTGLFNAAAYKGVRKRYIAQGLARYLRDPKGVHEAVVAASKTIENRSTAQAIAMRDAIDSIVEAKGKYAKAVNWFERHTYFAQTALQNIQDVIVWLGGYESAKARGLSEDDAAKFGDAVVRQTQGDQTPESISRIETGTGWQKLLLGMYGYFNMWANQLSTEFRSAMRDLGLKSGKGRLAYIYIVGFAAPALLAQLVVDMIRGDVPDDDDEPLEYWLSWFFGTQAKTAAAMVPFAGSAAIAGVNAFNDKPYDDRVLSSPAISVLETSIRVPVDIYDYFMGQGDASRTIKDTLTLATLLTGVPFQALARPLGYAADVAEGDVEPKDGVDYARGLVAGR